MSSQHKEMSVILVL